VRRLAGLVLALVLPAAAAAAEVTVFAAASLRDALDEAALAFQKSSGHRVVASYAGSNTLARQIEKGAPAHLFISADTEWVDELDKRGLVRPGSRVNLVGNELVLIAPAASTVRVKLVPGVDLGGVLGNKRIAIADPDAVPAGKYAKAAFSKLGLWGLVQAHAADTDNVRGALALVARGEAPLGVVYRTDAMEDKAVRIVDAFPPESYPPIVYPMVRLKRDSEAADALAAWLRGAQARATFERFGFRAP
jgi:molybdate transport system substrate-binding protein